MAARAVHSSRRRVRRAETGVVASPCSRARSSSVSLSTAVPPCAAYRSGDGEQCADIWCGGRRGRQRQETRAGCRCRHRRRRALSANRQRSGGARSPPADRSPDRAAGARRRCGGGPAAHRTRRRRRSRPRWGAAGIRAPSARAASTADAARNRRSAPAGASEVTVWPPAAVGPPTPPAGHRPGRRRSARCRARQRPPGCARTAPGRRGSRSGDAAETSTTRSSTRRSTSRRRRRHPDPGTARASTIAPGQPPQRRRLWRPHRPTRLRSGGTRRSPRAACGCGAIEKRLNGNTNMPGQEPGQPRWRYRDPFPHDI